MSKIRCIQCGKLVGARHGRAVFLWLLPGDGEAWLCGPKCDKEYEEEGNDVGVEDAED